MELIFAPKSMFILKVPQKPSVLTCDIWFATPFSSRKFKGPNPKLVRRSRSDDYYEGEVQPFDHKRIGMKSWMQVLPSKLELLDPSSLGICPDPPDWPERDEVCRVSIEQKAKFFGIPHSLRMIKRKQIWRDGFADAGEFAYCSVKKAFSSLVLIIRELQSYTFGLREGLNCEDLIDVMNKMQRDMTLAFVWLFRQVFSKTPTLMVYVMLLLANYSLHSMNNKAFIDGTQQQEVRLVENVTLLDEEETDGELGLWRSMVEEASRMRGEVYHKVIDHQIRQQLVSPLSVALESDNDEEIMHARMDLVYQMRIAEEPDNPLFLSNYAQFLSLVVKDHDRAEECFKRAIQIEPQDVEALEQYAEFLWKVRNDLPEAEERYIQAMAADQDNPFSISKYAYFLWTTGNEGTCYPLNSCDGYNKFLKE